MTKASLNSESPKILKGWNQDVRLDCDNQRHLIQLYTLLGAGALDPLKSDAGQFCGRKVLNLSRLAFSVFGGGFIKYINGGLYE